MPQEANGTGSCCCAAASTCARFCQAESAGTTMTEGTKPTFITPAKSLRGSNSSLLNTPGLMANELLTMSSVCPSGLASATILAPILPLAPGLLSTTTGTPSCCCNSAPACAPASLCRHRAGKSPQWSAAAGAGRSAAPPLLSGYHRLPAPETAPQRMHVE